MGSMLYTVDIHITMAVFIYPRQPFLSSPFVNPKIHIALNPTNDLYVYFLLSSNPFA